MFDENDNFSAAVGGELETPIISNTKTKEKQCFAKPTKQILNIPRKKLEAMTEDLSDLMYKLGYESDAREPLMFEK